MSKYKTMDANEAVARVAYKFTEVAGIYPITPASPMAEKIDVLSSNNEINFWGNKVKIVEMQSEAGAVATVHGALQSGILASTFTASQGLLLMIPTLYKLSGEMLPGVIHVAARSLSTHSLSIFGDHQDIYAVRQTGVCMLSSASPEEAYHMAMIAHLSSIKSSLPFINFFDGFRTSHEIDKIKEVDLAKIETLIDKNALKQFRDRAISNAHPNTRGTAENEDVYFQHAESRNKDYTNAIEIVENYMNKINKITKKDYKPFNYYGSKNADKVIIAMGSVCECIEEVVDKLNTTGYNVGLVKVHLYRPFSINHLKEVLPKTVKQIAVLDRTKEPGSVGEPLYIDVVNALKDTNINIIGGRYGLSSKNTTPLMIKAVYDNLKEEKKNFVPFKAGYGVELEMTESKLNVVFNPNDELIEDNTFVIFDTETTGFNPGLSDSMIEIGAVKLKNGEVVDRFDELINPGRHIDESITRVTNISDDDVKDADNEENVIKRFKEWIGSLPLVAHNARFDKNMLDMAYYKYNLGKLENPIIDTLMLSRVVNRELKKHSLKALGKFYGIDTGEAEDEEQSDTALPSGSFKFDDEDGEKIEDVLVDSESILKVQSEEYLDNDITTESKVTKVRNTYYLTTIYRKSKTEKCEIEVKFKDGSVIKRDFTLHPAENACVINYASTFGEKEIPVTIYVGQHHGADVDSENTGYIFNKMLKQIEGLTKISELNDLYKLEDVAFRNDHKKLGNIAELCSYKNYVIPAEEDKTYEDKDYPFLKYDNKNYVWKFPWCKDDFLQMYENIPGKTFTENLANIYDFTKHVTFIAKNKVGLKNMFYFIIFLLSFHKYA